jgi:3'-phosphoadenosine 5'-phosphosulfate sulfotransferase (PAPS reductase)/FAD synthetase
MISVEYLERLAWPDAGRETPAAKITFQGKHFLKDKDIMPLFRWTKDDIWRVRTNCT